MSTHNPNELLHCQQIAEVWHRVASLTMAAHQGRTPPPEDADQSIIDMEMAIEASRAENLGLCHDCLMTMASEAGQAMAEAADNMGEDDIACLLAAAWESGLQIGLILGRENPR